MPTTKIKLLERLREAKQGHINWMHNIKLMVYGYEVNKQSIPLNTVQSKFGQWIYGEAQKIKSIHTIKREYILEVEASHLKTYTLYFHIHRICSDTKSNRNISTLLSLKPAQQEHEMAKQYYKELEVASKELMYHTLRLEKYLLSFPLDEIKE